MAHLQPYLRLVLPFGHIAFEETREKPLLQGKAVIGVIMGPMFDTMHFQPFVLGSRAQIALKITARMQALPTPVGRRQQWHGDFREIRGATGIEFIFQLVLDHIGIDITAVRAQFLVGQRVRTRYPIAIHTRAVTALAKPVLHCLDLHIIPVLQEGAVDAAVTDHVAVKICAPFPDAHSRQTAWLHRRHLPLVDRIIGNAAQAHFAVRPRLIGAPFHTGGKILGFTGRPMIDIAR